MPFLPENVKQLRTKLSLTVDGLGEKLSCTGQTVSNWERGRNHPRIEQIDALHNLADSNGLNLTFYTPPQQTLFV